MKTICLYLQMHQPWRVRPYSYFEIGRNHQYFDKTKNQAVVEKVNDKSYRPMLTLLNELLEQYDQFCFTVGVSGTLLEQWQLYSPDVVRLIYGLMQSGRVELLGETYYHSLAYLWSMSEWERQVRQHLRVMQKLFGVQPKVFRNTELVFENRLAPIIAKLGFTGTLVEGWDPILGWRQPTYVYSSICEPTLKILTKHYRLSDDIAFRFSEPSWQFYPLNVNQYREWLNGTEGQCINLFMDFETFGEHQWAKSGIFGFFHSLIGDLMRDSRYQFKTPSQIFESFEPLDTLDIPYPVSWADTERDLSAWLGNRMQHQVIETLYDLEDRIIASGDPTLIQDWRRLQTSDHFYYMCTKWFADGDVHKYFNPYDSPYDAYIYYQLILEDVKWRLNSSKLKTTTTNLKDLTF